jgi:hypothetical protein
MWAVGDSPEEEIHKQTKPQVSLLIQESPLQLGESNL